MNSPAAARRERDASFLSRRACNQGQSGSIRFNHGQSVAIRGSQMHRRDVPAIRGN